MCGVNHDGYLQACYHEGVAMGRGETDPQFVSDIQAHFKESARCEACLIDLQRGRPDDFEEFKFLSRYIDNLANGTATKEQREAARCISLKYGGKSPAELVSRYREAHPKQAELAIEAA